MDLREIESGEVSERCQKYSVGNSGENSESQNADRSVDNKEENKVSLGELDYRPLLIPAKNFIF